MNDDSKIRCPRCNSDQVYHRLKKNNHRCKTCGNIFIVESYGGPK